MLDKKEIFMHHVDSIFPIRKVQIEHKQMPIINQSSNYNKTSKQPP